MSRSAYGLEAGPEVVVRWEEKAACRMGGRLGDPDAWFIASKLRWLAEEANREALFICQHECPVRLQCAEDTEERRVKYSLAGEIRGGFWFDASGNVRTEPGSGRIR